MKHRTLICLKCFDQQNNKTLSGPGVVGNLGVVDFTFDVDGHARGQHHHIRGGACWAWCLGTDGCTACACRGCLSLDGVHCKHNKGTM